MTASKAIGDDTVSGILRLVPLMARRSVVPGLVAAHLPANDEAPAAARRMVAESMVDPAIDPDQLHDVLLVVSELVTNVVRHGGSSVGIRVHRRHEAVEVQVTDHATGVPAAMDSPETAPTGRGLAIVGALCRAWGVIDRPDAKTVWCRVEPDFAANGAC